MKYENALSTVYALDGIFKKSIGRLRVYAEIGLNWKKNSIDRYYLLNGTLTFLRSWRQ